VPQSAEQMSFISHQLSPSRKAICGVAIDNFNGNGKAMGRGRERQWEWELKWKWELKPFGNCRCAAYNLANWLMMSVM